MTDGPRPNFFIVGAPRCGTTSLYEYLRVHPQVFMPARKELHFFGRDITGPPAPDPVKDRGRYLAWFLPAGTRARVGDASAMYLSSRYAAAEIREFCAEARIIVMLRNPVDLLYSLYCTGFYPEMRRMGLESYADHESVDKLVRNARHVRRYLDAFGQEQVHVIVHDDLVAAPRPIYRDTCAFLGIDTSFVPAFEVHAPGRAPRFQGLRDAIAEPGLSRGIARRLVPARLRASLRPLLWRIATMPPPPLDPTIRRRLEVRYRDEVLELGMSLHRNLSAWRGRGAPVE